MNDLCPLPGCRVDRVVTINPEVIRVVAHGHRDHDHCPDCGRVSGAVHSRDDRHPADLPSFGREVRLSLDVRRFYCRNGACPRRTFAERLPGLLAPHARRTRRLAKAQGRLGVALGGEAGARLSSHLAMSTSADTLLRLVRRCGVHRRGDGHPSSVEERDAWRAEARSCGVAVVKTFAAGLEQDGAAGRAALTLPWSNGQAEGQITRLKLLKRSMYGRAKLDLLRRRVLLAA